MRLLKGKSSEFSGLVLMRGIFNGVLGKADDF